MRLPRRTLRTPPSYYYLPVLAGFWPTGRLVREPRPPDSGAVRRCRSAICAVCKVARCAFLARRPVSSPARWSRRRACASARRSDPPGPARRRAAPGRRARPGRGDLDAIADEANVSRRTFSNYFANKEDALLHGDRMRIGRLLDLLRARPAEETPWQALTAAPWRSSRGGAVDPDWVAQIRLLRRHPTLPPSRRPPRRPWKRNWPPKSPCVIPAIPTSRCAPGCWPPSSWPPCAACSACGSSSAAAPPCPPPCGPAWTAPPNRSRDPGARRDTRTAVGGPRSAFRQTLRCVQDYGSLAEPHASGMVRDREGTSPAYRPEGLPTPGPALPVPAPAGRDTRRTGRGTSPPAPPARRATRAVAGGVRLVRSLLAALVPQMLPVAATPRRGPSATTSAAASTR